MLPLTCLALAALIVLTPPPKPPLVPTPRTAGFATPGALLALALPAFLLALAPYLLPYVGPAAAALTVALFTLAARALVLHAKASRARHYALALMESARVGVLYVEQAVAPTLRGPDGKLSPVAGERAKTAAVTAALDWLRLQGLGAVKSALGLTDDQLAQQLGIQVEAQVATLPSSSLPAAPTERLVNPLTQAQPGEPGPHVVVKPAGA